MEEDQIELVEILDQAVEIALDKGYRVDGWMFQRDEDGFVAWLYWEDEVEQGAVFDEVEIIGSPIAAAKACLARAAALPPQAASSDDVDN